jgi:hypothetical protein
MKRILSFSDFAIFEYSGFNYSGYSGLNEAIYLDERNKTPHDPAALKKMRACIFFLNGSYPFFSSMLSRLLIRENRNLRFNTMATDGVSIHYDPDFVLKHSDAEIMWVIAHEVLHNTLVHFLRCPKDKTKAGVWNVEADYALNQILTPIDPSTINTDKPKPSSKGGIGKFVEGSLYPGCGHVPYDHEFVNRGAEWIYEKLLANGYVPEPGNDTTPPPPPPPPPPPQDPVVGDIIYDKDNDSYGIVKSIDDSSGELEYDPIPQSKVKEYLKRKESGENILGDDIGKELDF